MNCLIFKCDQTAQYPFPCCNLEHGKKFNEIKTVIKGKQKDTLTGWGENIYFHLTQEEKDYYNKII
jgi:hypothetical protein